MKTIILSLDEALIQAVENQARHTGQTPDNVIQHVLREALLTKSTGKPYKLRWVTVEGHSQPGVDLDDRGALLDRMEGRT
jgi:hypothetical protein